MAASDNEEKKNEVLTGGLEVDSIQPYINCVDHNYIYLKKVFYHLSRHHWYGWWREGSESKRGYSSAK